ncbi:hypothetical protein ElyMa_004058000 [Elysia marginata]|uniref:Uncharacterized protein n=1 Tax=Elysia marginata TaxID=1093978 RepID=A0AAV4G679_9GAST|nr:hypothetical protein ElyMa_004058000 [Elysia marginata]
MGGYFVTEGSKFKGRSLTTLPVVLNRDLSRIINSNLQLKSSHDLEHMRSIAQQRDEWTKLTLLQRGFEKQPRRPSRSTEMRKALSQVSQVRCFWLSVGKLLISMVALMRFGFSCYFRQIA